jgi:hypothetical protein
MTISSMVPRLLCAGFHDVRVLRGGSVRWNEAGLPAR